MKIYQCWISAIAMCISVATANAQTLTKATAVERIQFLIGTPNFSSTQSLSQKQLLALLFRCADKLPQRYIDQRGGKVAGWDEYTTRNRARLFIREIVGGDLTIWPPTKGNPDIVGDEIGWWYNTANTMYEDPFVKNLKLSRLNGTYVYTFDIWHKAGNLVNDPPAKRIGTGSASSKREANAWVVIKWSTRM